MSERIERLQQSPPAEIVARLIPLIEAACEKVDEGQDCRIEIAEINALSGHDYGPEHFFELDSYTSTKDFAEVAAMGPPPLMSNLSRAELVEVLQIVMGVSGAVDAVSTEYFVEFLDRNLPTVWSSDLVFWPTVERSPEELADYLITETARVR